MLIPSFIQQMAPFRHGAMSSNKKTRKFSAVIELMFVWLCVGVVGDGEEIDNKP